MREIFMVRCVFQSRVFSPLGCKPLSTPRIPTLADVNTESIGIVLKQFNFYVH